MIHYIVSDVVNLLNNQNINLSSIISCKETGLVTTDTTSVAVFIDAKNVELILTSDIPDASTDIVASTNNVIYLTVNELQLYNIKVKSNNSNDNGVYITDNSSSVFNETANTPVVGSNIDRGSVDYYSYYFGINDCSINRKIFNETSGYIINNISISKYSNLELVVDDVVNDKCSIEYYIIDGLKEVPILPKGIEYVNNELVIGSIGTRFKSEPGSLKYDAINDKTVVSYKPIGNCNIYNSNSDNVSLKVIMRIYEGNTSPIIKNIVLREVSNNV